MAKFSDDFLAKIKDALPPSVVLGAKYKLRKQGAEYVAEEDKSITCNDAKQVWREFGKGDKGGDIFAFVQWSEGVDFIEAVKRLAQKAGIPLPEGHERKRNASEGRSKGGNDADQGQADPAPVHDGGSADRAGRAEGAASDGKARSKKREIVATYDYVDEQGYLLYQVVRYDPKGFAQRRPYREEDGPWVWALDAGEFMRRGPGTDWYRYDAKRYADWHLTERRKIDGGVGHGLYRLPELIEAIADERLIFLPEGEKDCDTLDAMGLAATTNSGGAKHWTPEHAGRFRGASVVILIDNDDAGRERGHKVAYSLRGIAVSIKVLDLSRHWTGMVEKGDVTDWIAAGGTKEKLYALVEATPEWKPEPPESKFGALRYIDLDLPAREYAWLIKGLLTRGERSVLAGAPGSGKTFLAGDMGMAVARAALEPGYRYLGRKVHGGLVMYQAGEGGLGLRMRMKAYRKYHDLRPDLNLPFVLMPQKLDLFSGPEATDQFIDECKKWSAFYEMPVELAVVDTFSAASAGANENLSEDMTVVLDRGQAIAHALQCHVMFVHHMNKQGGVRGWSGILGNIESAIECAKTEDFESERMPDGHEVRRVVREAVLTKQKDGEDGLRWRFVLPKVILGYDDENDPVTSCVVRQAGEVALPSKPVDTKRDGTGLFLSDERAGLFTSLLKTLDEVGVAPPAGLKLPASVSKVCKWGQFRYAYRKRVVPTEEDAKSHDEKIKSRLRRFGEFGQQAGIIAIEHVEDVAWVWVTGKPVFGRGLQYPRQQPKPKDDGQAPLIDPATGEPMEDIDKSWF